VLLRVLCRVLDKNRRKFRAFMELVLFRNERNADFHGGSFFEAERFGRNQNAIAIEGPNLARRGS